MFSGLLAMMAVMAFCIPGARAAVTTGSCDAATWDGEIIGDSGDPVFVVAFGATSDKADTDSLISIYINFSGTGFSTTDLLPLDTDSSTSGVGIYRDDGDTDDQPDINDTALTLDSVAWNSDQAQLTFANGDEYVPAKMSGSYQWGIAIRVNSTVSDGDQIDMTLLADNIVFSDDTTMPSKDVTTNTITVDAADPGSWADVSPTTWHTSSKTPTVTITVQDKTSGLAVDTAEYGYSTDGGSTWSGWTAASVTGSDGTTAAETITAKEVPFDQDSGTLNSIRFRINDMVGHTGTSGAYTVQVDASPPGNWASISPSGWHTASQAPTVTVSVQETTSGLNVSTAEYRYSTDGGTSWSAWTATSVTGSDGTTNAETITATAVPFGQDSPNLNQIEFRITDMAGNTGTSSTYTIKIDTLVPGGWANISPSGWHTASQTVTVTVQVQDLGSGLDVSSAEYRYSTDGGTSWSAWTATSVTGTDGTTAAETITATDVPFGQDSDTQNQIQFRIADELAGTGTSSIYTIKIDTEAPAGWTDESPTDWVTTTQAPDVTVKVQDTMSGLAVASAQYRYSTDGGSTWSAWTAATVTGSDGTTAAETITASAVPFDKDSGTLNQIEFSITDVAGNTGYSGTYTIKVDESGPADWTNLKPAGWCTTSQTVTVTIDVSDPGSGIDTATAYYSYSTDGGSTWSSWAAASITGSDGSTGVETITATDVPFGQDSGNLNQIQFKLDDLNANTGTSTAYAIKIDLVEPGSWADIDPSGWYTTSQAPDVTISVQDATSGLDTAAAEYRYSIDGGSTWSDWAAASVSGSDGSTSAETVTAGSVPFGQDSGSLNQIEFRIKDMAGITGTSKTYTIKVDSVAPGSWASISPSSWYTTSQTPDVTISVQDATSGLGVSTAEYRYSTDGGSTWSKWASAKVTGSDGTTSAETITASSVPFNADSGTLNQIEFRIIDLAGNTGSSSTYTIKIDTGAPGSWASISPGAGEWYSASQRPTVTITVQDLGSGLDVDTAYYQYSTDGGKSWSKWASASVSGKDETTGVETITAANVPFGQDSASLNLIQFEVNDILGNTGTSKSYTIQIDTTVPGNWAALTPSGWYTASQAPDVTITVQDVTSGLGVTTAYYQYSTDGGKSWSRPAAASVTGKDGDTGVQTITAARVPFNQDSGTQNQIIFEITDIAGNTGTSKPCTIQIDTLAPASWANVSPAGWHNSSQAPTVTISVQDVTSGIRVASASYQFSTDGGTTWSLLIAATVSGADGSTGVETITALNVPFNQDSATLNKIMFMIADIAGNNGTSLEYIIKVDTTPPGSWAEVSPPGWFNASKTPTVTIKVRDLTSGLDVSDAEYRYSTDGGTTWSAWAAATTSGADGTTSIELLTASNVPFNLDSGTLNRIQFRMTDMADVIGTSEAYIIMIDTAPPAGWAGQSPAGWVNSTKTPTVTITVKDNTSGLSAASVQYQYSINGGTTWSAWAAAAVSGADGTIEMQTVTAASVPFGADSSAGNRIRFRIVDIAGNVATSADYIIKVDTTTPGSWNAVMPSGWHNSSLAPTVTVEASDATAGLGVGTASYQFSTDGGATWSDWIPADVTGADGATDALTIRAVEVAFNQDSGSLNMIRFRISDMAGNVGTSVDSIIKIDSTAPAGWTGVSPSGWFNQSRTPTVTLLGSDATSGLQVSSAQYQFTNDGGASWSAWKAATVTGTDGTTGAQTLTAASVQFNLDSANLNKIRFRMTDIAGNMGVSDDFTILIDLVAPADWAGLTPPGWYNQSRTPSVTVQVSDLMSGLNVTGASYQYSTNGGTSWSGWTAATVTGTAGTTAIQTLTAANVPFNADSAGLNRIRFKITDMAGNVGTSADYTVKVDTTPPATSMTALPAYSKTRTLQLAFSATDNVSGLAKLELWFSVNDGEYQLRPGNVTASPITFEAASEGAYSFILRGTDFAGNYEDAPAVPDAKITVKTTMPEPVLKIKEGGETTESSAHVSGTVEPGSKVLVNDKEVPVDASGKFSATISLNEGSNKINVTVTDPAGNTKSVEKNVNRKAAFPMMTLVLVIVIVVVLVAVVAVVMRMRGRKGGPAETPATPKNDKAPEEATPVTEENN